VTLRKWRILYDNFDRHATLRAQGMAQALSLIVIQIPIREIAAVAALSIFIS
jgi:hypothetical protein